MGRRERRATIAELQKMDYYFDFYQEFRNKVKAWANTAEAKNHKYLEYILVAPDLFHLLCRLVFDDEVPREKKWILATAVTYFVSPIDLIPEAVVGPLGYIDDVAVGAFALNHLMNHVDPAIVRKHWSGEGDILEVVRGIVARVDSWLGSGLASKVRKMFEERRGQGSKGS
jgi:uncharacterized membrane protein YkvA (DUF1232 family)